MNYITIGTFDGVHRGHQALLKRLVAEGRRTRLPTTALVFERPPRLLFQPDLPVRLLTTPAERAELIRSLGVDRVKLLKFNHKVAARPPRAFFEHALVRDLKAAAILVGEDFRFGRHRAGDAKLLKELCREKGLKFALQKLKRRADAKVSSTRIRDDLDAGRLKDAASLLGRPYFITGRVVRGRGLGRKLGFPTANLKVEPGKLLPRGVFSARALWDNRSRPAAVNIGFRPTVGGLPRLSVEAHLPGFKGSLVGKKLKLELLRRLRPEKKFPSLKALQAQISRDVRAV